LAIAFQFVKIRVRLQGVVLVFVRVKVPAEEVRECREDDGGRTWTRGSDTASGAWRNGWEESGLGAYSGGKEAGENEKARRKARRKERESAR
jgi:hypothetical protein